MDHLKVYYESFKIHQRQVQLATLSFSCVDTKLAYDTERDLLICLHKSHAFLISTLDSNNTHNNNCHHIYVLARLLFLGFRLI
jgi:hypothetical protein